MNPKRHNLYSLVRTLAVAAAALLAAPSVQGDATAVIYDTPNVLTFATEVAGTMPLQTIDTSATGPGALTPEQMEALPGLFVNAYWRDPLSAVIFAQAQGNRFVRNYLAFTAPNNYAARAAFRFAVDLGSSTGQWTGGYNSTGPRIVVSAGESIFLEQVLAASVGGAVEITVGSYTSRGRVEDEEAFGFTTHDGAGNAYATRAVGFIIAGMAEGTVITAHFHGIDGELVGSIDGTSIGETNPAENAAGGEVFFGFDAGPDPANWVSRITLSGHGGGNIGLDDFAFLPVAAVSPAGNIVLPVHPDVLHLWDFIEPAGTPPPGAANFGNAAVDGGPRFSNATLGGYATDGEGALRINGVNYGTVLSQSVVNLGPDIAGEAWFRWDLAWNFITPSANPREVFLIHRVDGVAGSTFRLAVENRASGATDLLFDGAGVGGGRLAIGQLSGIEEGVSFIYGVTWNDEGAIDSLRAYFSDDGGITFRDLNAVLGDPGAANLGEIRVHAKGDFSSPDNWIRINRITVASSPEGIGLPELPVPVDPDTVFADRPLWPKFADKDLVPGQGIDVIATGEGAATPAQLEALERFSVNTEFSGFLPVRTSAANHLLFTRTKAAFRFVIEDDPETGDEFAGFAAQADFLKVSGPAGAGQRHTVYLGILGEDWGSYTITVGAIERDVFHRSSMEGNPYAVRAAGFVVANVLAGATIYADFIGIDGRVLTTLEGAGQTGEPFSEDGDEVFFGYDAGANPLNWIARIVIRGRMDGKAGFDDFGFSPVFSITPDGTALEPQPFVEEEVSVDGLLVDAPLFNTFATRNLWTSMGQEVNRNAYGPGVRPIEHSFTGAPLGVASVAYITETWNAQVQRGVAQGQVSIAEEAGNRFMRVLYPEGLLADGGAQWNAFIGSTDEAVAEYRFRFEEEFEWTEGGKLPGLAGGSAAVGGNPQPDGFTARYMWGPTGTIFLYLYHSEQPGQYGQGIGLGGSTAVRGQWHTIRQRIKLNTPGEPDGVLQVWFDGNLVLDRQDMRWRREGTSWNIDKFYFSTFHGGNSDPYRPSRDNHIDFDDFRVVPADNSGQARSMRELENLPGMRVNTDWIVGTDRFAGKGNQMVSRNALHYSDTGTGALFTLNHLNVGGYQGSGGTTTGIRETVTRMSAVYVGFIDENFVEYTITFGAYDPAGEVFRTVDPEGRPYVGRAAGFILSGINDGALINASYYNAEGDLLTTLAGYGNDENAGSGIEIFYGHDAGAHQQDWIRKIVITGLNRHPTGGSYNMGLDDFGFTPVTPLGLEPPLPPIWSDGSYPLLQGWRQTGLGLQQDAHYPWVYHYQTGDWVWYAPFSGLHGQYLFLYALDQWAFTAEDIAPYAWLYGDGEWALLE